MRRFRLGAVPAPRELLRAPAVTVGVFDGVHRGHEAVLAQVRAAAREHGGDAAVVTFDPHPREVLTGQGPPLLTRLDHRVVLLGRAGIAGVLVVPFDREVASWEPETFVERVLVESLGARAVLIGADHRFGRARRGDLALLQALGQRFGFEARALALETEGDEVVSSTRIRAAIAQGALAEAEALLGREVSVLGTVIAGDQRGRTLGFPTANLDLGGTVRPPRGVYAARARTIELDGPAGCCVEGPLLPAVVNIGRRPTFHPEQGHDLVEVHLLEGGRDLYGAQLEVAFVAHLRDERRFEGPEALKRQIEADIAQARALLAG